MLLLPALTLALAAVPAQDSIGWTDGLPYGPHPVAFTSFELSRPDGPAVRRVRVTLWYPAGQERSGARVTLGQLFSQIEEETRLGPASTTERILAVEATGDSLAVSEAVLRRALATPTRAVHGSGPRGARLPLVVWGVRNATVLAQAPISEVLASHGVLVAATWSADPPTSFPWTDSSDSLRRATRAARGEDMAFAARALADSGWADTSRIALLAWSYGGWSASHIQEVLGGVRVVVGLDANVVAPPWDRPTVLRHPFIALFGRDTASRRLDMLDSLDQKVLTVRLPELAHGNFNALEGYLPGLLESPVVWRWSRGGRLAVQGYRTLARLTLAIVTEFLSDNPPPWPTLDATLRKAAASTPIEVTRRGRW